jgi:hypothetical protein
MALSTSVPARAAVTVTSHFVYTTTSVLTVGDSAYINDGATDGQPRDLVFETINQTPLGVCGCAVPSRPTGVWYDPTRQLWAVFNEDASAMPTGMAFNILVVSKASKFAFVQTATHANVRGNHTFLNSTLLNGKPGAIMQVTQNFNPGATLAGTSDPHVVGVQYFPKQKRWAIVNENGPKMLIGTAFNVLIGQSASNGGKAVVARVTQQDHKNGALFINNGQTNGNPNNVTFETSNINPGGKGGVANPHPVQVSYHGIKPFQEIIENLDNTAQPVNAAFNLLIFSS